MSTTAEKLIYLNETKTAIKEAIVAKGIDIEEGATFRSYADRIAEIETKTPLQEKTIDITENGSYEATPDEGYALGKVTANVDIFVPTQQAKTAEFTENGEYTITPDEGHVLNSVTIGVNVPTGGGGAEGLPESIVFSGDCTGVFKNGTWDWAIGLAGDRMSTSDISNLSNTFKGSALETIPFDLNITSGCKDYSYCELFIDLGWYGMVVLVRIYWSCGYNGMAGVV